MIIKKHYYAIKMKSYVFFHQINAVISIRGNYESIYGNHNSLKVNPWVIIISGRDLCSIQTKELCGTFGLRYLQREKESQFSYEIMGVV